MEVPTWRLTGCQTAGLGRVAGLWAQASPQQRNFFTSKLIHFLKSSNSVSPGLQSNYASSAGCLGEFPVTQVGTVLTWLHLCCLRSALLGETLSNGSLGRREFTP